MRISVFGLGYVGAVASACLAESGHDVIAVDTNPDKILSFRAGKSPIIEPGLSDLIQKHVGSGRLSATMDAQEAILNSDLSFLCVGTPSRTDGSLDLSHVESVCETVGRALKTKTAFHSVVLRSTVLPGSSRQHAIPALEQSSGKKAGRDFGFATNPEFLRESTAIQDYFAPPKIVIGVLDQTATDEPTTKALETIYNGIDAPKIITAIEVSEAVKYASNAWHAMKVGFANELGNIFKAHDIDSHAVMDIFCLDTKLNISPAYMKPGFAFGGSCLPKDVRALRASGQAKDIKTPLFDALLTANQEQVNRAYQMILRSGKTKIGLLGLSFKAGSDDLRESPLVTLADLLVKEGLDIVIYDPSVSKEAAPHLSFALTHSPDDLLTKANLLVIGNHGKDYGDIIARANDNCPVIDLVRLKNKDVAGRAAYTGICW